MSDSLTGEPVPFVVADVPHAPFIYFDDAPALGFLPGVITVTLAAHRPVAYSGNLTNEAVAVAYLRCNINAARSLREALDKALLAAMPVEQGAEGSTKQ